MNVQVKGSDDKLLITISHGGWEERSKELIDYVCGNAGFLSGAKVVLCLDEFILKANDLFTIRNSFADYQVVISGIQTNREETRQAARLLGIPLEDARKLKEQVTRSNKSTDHGEKNLFLTKNLRSGSLTETVGSITVIGDVHPGAVVKATGNIFVWGKLCGEVQAGISNDLTCIVCALILSPSHLSIAGFPMDTSSKKLSKFPQIARCTGNAITIETWKN